MVRAKTNVTLHDVARRAKVSHVSVSAVLNRPSYKGEVSDQTAARIRRIAEKMGYVPNQAARALKVRKTRAVVLATYGGLTHPYYNELIEAIYLALAAKGYHLILELLYAAPDVEQVFRTFEPSRCDGVIFMGQPRVSAQWLEFTRRVGMPVISVNYAPSRDFPTAGYDQERCTRIGMDHLLAQGHRRIALVFDVQQALPREQRLRGYRAALGAAGVPFDQKLLFPWAVVGADPNELWRKIAAVRPRPTAMYVYNAELAAGLLRAIRGDRLKVPGDVAIVTHTNPRLTTQVEVPLTAVDINNAELARALVDLLQEYLQDPGQPPRHVSVEPFLVVRASSRKETGATAPNRT